MLCSDNPRKCCKYARKRNDESYLLRCKVIMGDIKVSQDLVVILLISFMVFIAIVVFFCKTSLFTGWKLQFLYFADLQVIGL